MDKFQQHDKTQEKLDKEFENFVIENYKELKEIGTLEWLSPEFQKKIKENKVQKEFGNQRQELRNHKEKQKYYQKLSILRKEISSLFKDYIREKNKKIIHENQSTQTNWKNNKKQVRSTYVG